MLIKYRWIKIHLPTGSQELATLSSKRPFNSEFSQGFAQVEKVTGGENYRFFWRTRVVVTTLDPEGLPRYEQISSVSFTDFAVVTVNETTFLRIENPGRSIRDLLNALEEFAGMGFTARTMTFDKGRPSTVFTSVDSSKLVGLKVVGAVLADDLVARMEFASKAGMVIEEMSALKGLKYKVELAVFELVLSGLKGLLAFSANGTLKISGQLAPKLLSLIEQDLPTLS